MNERRRSLGEIFNHCVVLICPNDSIIIISESVFVGRDFVV